VRLGEIADKFRVGVQASVSFSDAGPGYGSRIGWTTLGSLPMAPSQGAQRWATYRSVYVTNPWVYASVQMLSKRDRATAAARVSGGRTGPQLQGAWRPSWRCWPSDRAATVGQTADERVCGHVAERDVWRHDDRPARVRERAMGHPPGHVQYAFRLSAYPVA